MRRVILNKIFRRTVWGIALVLLSYIMVSTGFKQALLDIEPPLGQLYFLYVLSVAFLPDLVSGIGYGVLFSVAFLLMRYFIFPVHMVERRYMAIKRSGLFKPLVICGLIVFLIFLVPYFMRWESLTGEAIAEVEQFGMQAAGGASMIGGYAGMVLASLAILLYYVIDVFFVKPLYLFSAVRLDAFAAGIFLAVIFYHSATVSLCKKRVKVERHASMHVCQEGETVTLTTSMQSPLPLPALSLPAAPIPSGKIIGWKMKSEKNLLSTSVRNAEDYQLREGYYNFDLVPVKISTLPFLSTTVYKVSDTNSDVSVLPDLKFRTRMFIQRPTIAKETGSLIRRQLGSSLDFADMREYTHDDPFSRIWWKGLAKYGKLMVKDFHSFGEDRWMLVLDFTNPNMGEENAKSMLRFARLFIELCTRKDIAIGLSAFSPTFRYTDYQTSKKNLLTSLTKVTSPVYEISTKGIELIMKDAVGADIGKLEVKCRNKKITLSTVYFYSGLGSRNTFFSWRGEETFMNCMKRFFTSVKRSGKIVIVTDGNPANIEAYRKFRAMCKARHYNYIFIVTEDRKDIMDQMKAAKIKRIFVPWEELAKPRFVVNLVSLV